MQAPTLSLTDLLTSGSNGSLDIRISNVVVYSSGGVSGTSVQVTTSVNFNNPLNNQSQNQNQSKTYTGTPQEIHDSIVSDVVLSNLLTVI